MKFRYTKYKKDSTNYISVTIETDITKSILSRIFGLTS